MNLGTRSQRQCMHLIRKVIRHPRFGRSRYVYHTISRPRTYRGPLACRWDIRIFHRHHRHRRNRYRGCRHHNRLGNW